MNDDEMKEQAEAMVKEAAIKMGVPAEAFEPIKRMIAIYAVQWLNGCERILLVRDEIPTLPIPPKVPTTTPIEDGSFGIQLHGAQYLGRVVYPDRTVVLVHSVEAVAPSIHAPVLRWAPLYEVLEKPTTSQSVVIALARAGIRNFRLGLFMDKHTFTLDFDKESLPFLDNGVPHGADAVRADAVQEDSSGSPCPEREHGGVDSGGPLGGREATEPPGGAEDPPRDSTVAG